MSFTPKIFGALETEILRGLEFAVSVEDHPDEQTGWVSPGARRCRLRIDVINRSEVRVRPLQGVLAPAAGVEFRLTPFRIEDLAPYREARVATIEAKLLGPVGTLDTLATVSLSGGAELTQFRFRQACRKVRIVDGAQARPSRRGLRQVVGAIPLSEEI